MGIMPTTIAAAVIGTGRRANASPASAIEASSAVAATKLGG
jgi:hypothetical protein